MRDWPPCPPIQQNGGRQSRPGVRPFISALTVARCPAIFLGVWPHFGTLCPQVGAQDEGRGLSYALSADETSPALAASRHTITALFSCRFKCPCPPRRQRHFHGNADRAYNTLHFASQSRVPNGGRCPLWKPPQEKAIRYPSTGRIPPFLVLKHGSPLYCGILFSILKANISNEWVARDTSRKVKSAFKTKFAEGAYYGAYAPLGYKKHPDIKGKLLVDEETRWIVEKIFSLAYQGNGAAKITKELIAGKVPTSAWLNFQRYGTFAHIFEGEPESKRYAWTIAQVKTILKSEVYIGNSVHNKQSTVSFKSKKKVRKPESEWFRVEDTHEPIIDKEVFYRVQEQIQARRRQMKSQTTQIFAGLVKCADCGWSMRFGTNRANSKPYSYFACSFYGQFGKGYCSMHYIRYDVLYEAVLERLQYWARAVRQDEEQVLRKIQRAGNAERIRAKKKAVSALKRAENRQKEVDKLFLKMYEDRASEKITERNFAMLSGKYQQEQIELEEQIESLREEIRKMEQEMIGAEKWIDLIKENAVPKELTATLLNTMIEKILIHASEIDENGERTQEIEIYYRFIGKID